MTEIQPPSAVDTAIELYNEILEAPVITRAVFAGNTLHVEMSSRSISQLAKRSASQTLTLDAKNAVVATSPLVFSSSEVQHASYFGGKTALFRAIGAGKERKLLIEIWEDGAKVEEVEVGKCHSDWHFDGASLCSLSRRRRAEGMTQERSLRPSGIPMGTQSSTPPRRLLRRNLPFPPRRSSTNPTSERRLRARRRHPSFFSSSRTLRIDWGTNPSTD